jgi:hypothetical protein
MGAIHKEDADAQSESGPRVGREAAAAKVDSLLDTVPLAEGVSVKLSRMLLGFLKADVLPQAEQAAELGMDPAPFLEVIARVLRTYADALNPPTGSTDYCPCPPRSSGPLVKDLKVRRRSP